MLMSVFYAYLYVAVQMLGVWGLYRRLNNPSIVDVSWSIGIMVTGLIYLLSYPMTLRTSVIAILLIVWGLRLAGYIWLTRIRLGHVDKRYLQLSDNWKIAKSLGFFLNFQLQGVFIILLSLPFVFAAEASNPYLTGLDYVAVLLIFIGLAGEIVADGQLSYYKKHQSKPVCDIGLWGYSRHPNYFFEWVIWLGFSLFALNANYGWLGLISPLWLLVIFIKFTIPITERGSIQSRGQHYIDYQNRTSKFIPWFNSPTTSA